MTNVVSNSNVAASVSVKLSQADKAKARAAQRAREEKAAKRAAEKRESELAKALASKPIAQAMADYIDASKKAEGGARVMFHHIATLTGMKEWHKVTAANARGNLKAVWDIVCEHKEAMKAAAKARGLVNTDKPWSDVRMIGRKELESGTTRTPKSLDVRMQTTLKALYKSAMREELPTEQELEVSAAIGRILATHFKVDLSTLG